MTRGTRTRENGRVMRPMYLMQVKTLAESRGEWDMAKLLGTVPAEKAFRPLAESDCRLVKH